MPIDNSNLINIICIAIFLIAICVAGGIKIYQTYKKNGEKFNFKDFVDKYGDQIIAVLQDVVKILKVSESKYSSKEEYEKKIIELTIEKIKENYNEIGIDIELLSLIPAENLSSIIYDILKGNAINIFSVLDDDDVIKNKELYDAEVVAIRDCNITTL